MAKANQRARAGKRTHAVENDYKIPIKDRMGFMRNRRDKWVNKSKYMDYIRWKGGR